MQNNNKEIVNQSEVITVRLDSADDVLCDEEFQALSAGSCSVIGTRKNQQDSLFSHFDQNSGIAVVCDGMGGLQGGELASQTAVSILVKDYFDSSPIANVPEFFCTEAVKVDQLVYNLQDASGMSMEAGTTLVSIIINNGELFWLSVGDSKIYIIRRNSIQCINRLHNYRMTMDEQLSQGTMTMEEYQANERHAEALISYIGMGNVSLMDINSTGFELEDNDIILLTSDGLYRLLTDEMIYNIVRRNMFDMSRAAQMLVREAEKRVINAQDNTSVVVVRYLEEIK